MEQAKEKRPVPPAPDPNSAKYKLNSVVMKHYREVQEAKQAGEKIGWCASKPKARDIRMISVRMRG